MSTVMTAGNEIDWASFAFTPPFPIAEPKRGAKRKGWIYERRAQRYLLEALGRYYWPSPWLCYRSDGSPRRRWCQPDGICVDPEAGVITVVEIKYSHTIDAYVQIEEKYIPVLRWLFPQKLWKFAALEVVHWYDPKIQFPRQVTMIKHPATVRVGDFGVHIYNP